MLSQTCSHLEREGDATLRPANHQVLHLHCAATNPDLPSDLTRRELRAHRSIQVCRLRPGGLKATSRQGETVLWLQYQPLHAFIARSKLSLCTISKSPSAGYLGCSCTTSSATGVLSASNTSVVNSPSIIQMHLFIPESKRSQCKSSYINASYI